MCEGVFQSCPVWVHAPVHCGPNSVSRPEAGGAGARAGVPVPRADSPALSGAAHAVGHRQPAAGPQHAAEPLQQPLRLWKVGKGVVDHHRVKLPGEVRLLRVAAEDGGPGIFFSGPRGHFRREVDAGEGGHATALIIRKEHAGAAGHIQHLRPGADACGVQNGPDGPLIADHARVPGLGTAVEKAADLRFFHHLRSGSSRRVFSSASTITGISTICRMMPGIAPVKAPPTKAAQVYSGPRMAHMAKP